MSRQIISRHVRIKLSEEQKEELARVCKEVENDPEIRRQGLAVKAECESRQREFADVMSALKAAREAAGLSLRDVEERTGINKSNLSLLENGKGNPTLETVRRIAEAIGRRVLITVE
jgi:DNA-binding XRE family transcriptional regulator